MKPPVNRREFLRATATTAVLSAGTTPVRAQLGAAVRADDAKPAKLGGPPAHPGGFPGWPVTEALEENALTGTLRSRHWFRGTGQAVSRFEAAYASLTGSKHCVATSSGTTALLTALGALDLGPGDEVLIPPYTFVATYNAVVMNYALPVFVDVDPGTFQIDAGRIPAALTPETRAIIPVHLGGSPADLDAILAAARARQVPVIEDACQAHLAEWRGRAVGTWGLAGCFSFQASKNLNCGEGGAVLTQDDRFAALCYNFHTQGRGRTVPPGAGVPELCRGTNHRLSEFQGDLLQAQMTRVVEQARRRTENAEHLTRRLSEIPGIRPAQLVPGTTRSAYHLYLFRYEAEAFAGLDRGKFLSALAAEGVPCSGGYSPLPRDPYVLGLARNPRFLRLYGEARMKRWLEQLECPGNDRLCREAVWFTQNLLLGTRTDMDQVADAIAKIHRHAAALARA